MKKSNSNAIISRKSEVSPLIRQTLRHAFALGLLAMAGVISARAGEDRFATLDGMKIHYLDRGTGARTIVLVHGWNCDSSVWQVQIDGLAPTMRVIAIDLPGHGQSEKPTLSYTMELHARAIDAVLREAKVERATLVGHSNGTPVVRQFYRMFPKKTEALVLVDGALRPFAEASEMEKFIAPMREPGYAEYVGKLVERMTRAMKDDGQREAVKTMMARAPQHVAVSEMEGLLRPELWTPDKIDVPTLIVLAKQPAWNADYERFVRELVPIVDYQVWEGVSHFLMLDKAPEFNAAVLAFVAKNAQ